MYARGNARSRLENAIASDKSELIAITGRRRVGKTFLVDTVLGGDYVFQMTGIKDADMPTQLTNFDIKLREWSKDDQGTSANWQMAMHHLKTYLQKLDSNHKKVLFFDELPWMATARSGFVQHLAHLWNDYLSKSSNWLLVICGSATSWIVDNIINDPGGMHNRITDTIHLLPFSLTETRNYLLTRNIEFTNYELAKYYMALGGVPYYLQLIERGESFAQAIERICFNPNGVLHREYYNLYRALFTTSEVHEDIVAYLAYQPSGKTRKEIARAINSSPTNGSFRRALLELVACSFVQENASFKKNKRDSLYLLMDEYSIFYHRFLKDMKYTQGIWMQQSTSQSYRSWCGLAFERLCLKHFDALKRALGISAVYTEQSALQATATDVHPGFQIDLIIDRKDDAINLCEMKFYAGPYTITKEYHQKLLQKKSSFQAYSGTRKQLITTLITSHGLTQNKYATAVDRALSLDDII